jgi:O-antigen/teichoic acid export membrane protein
MADGALRRGTVGRIYGNLGRLLGGKAAAGLISLAYLAIATRALGPADYGVLVLMHGYAMVIGGLVAFPGWHAIVRYGAQAVAAGDTPRLARLLRFAALVEGVAGLLAVAAAALLAPILGPRLGWSPTAVAFAGLYSFAVLGSIRATPAGYLQLARRFDLLGAHNLAAPLVRLGGAAVAVATHAGLRGFLIAWLTAALAEWAVMWALGIWVARGQLAGTRLVGGVRGVVAENPGLRRFMLAANADITLSELSGRLAPLAIGWVLGPAAAGLYAVAQRATVVLSQPALVLGQAAYAELARLVADGGRGAALRTALGRCIAIAVVAALAVTGLIAIFREPIAVLIGGRGFAAAGAILLWLACARAVLVVAPPISAALTALGRPGLSVTANLISGLGSLAVLPALLSSFGLAGAGAHALLQAAAATGLLAWFLWRETAADGSRAVSAVG